MLEPRRIVTFRCYLCARTCAVGTPGDRIARPVVDGMHASMTNVRAPDGSNPREAPLACEGIQPRAPGHSPIGTT